MRNRWFRPDYGLYGNNPLSKWVEIFAIYFGYALMVATGVLCFLFALGFLLNLFPNAQKLPLAAVAIISGLAGAKVARNKTTNLGPRLSADARTARFWIKGIGIMFVLNAGLQLAFIYGLWPPSPSIAQSARAPAASRNPDIDYDVTRVRSGDRYDPTVPPESSDCSVARTISFLRHLELMPADHQKSAENEMIAGIDRYAVEIGLTTRQRVLRVLCRAAGTPKTTFLQGEIEAFEAREKEEASAVEQESTPTQVKTTSRSDTRREPKSVSPPEPKRVARTAAPQPSPAKEPFVEQPPTSSVNAQAAAAPPPEEPVADRPGPVVVEAKKLRSAALVYPQRAWSRGTEGEVVVKFIVGVDGRPRDITVVFSTSRRLFNKEAVAYASSIRYSPKTVDGEAVETEKLLKINFELPN